MQSSLIVLGPNLCVKMANGTAAKLLGFEDFGDVLGMSVRDLLVSDAVYTQLGELRDNPDSRTLSGEILIKTSKNFTVPVIYTAQALIREDVQELEIIFVAHDIREKKELESKLLQSQKLESIGQLAAGIAHEINTPIQFVGDNTRFLQDAFSDLTPLLQFIENLTRLANSDVREPLRDQARKLLEESDVEFLTQEVPIAIEQALEGLSRVSKIVRAMKEFAHPGSDLKQLVDINALIESTTVVSKNEWKYIAELNFVADQKLDLVPCLPGEFNQTILNLIVNAAHAIEERYGKGKTSLGRINIETSKENNECIIRVSDNGAGIPEAAKRKIFDPFFTTKSVGKRTGQGLALVHSTVVEKHGGAISFDSELGVGTTFEIRLPLLERKEEQK